MMSTGSLASAWLPHHGEQNHDSTDTDPYCDHDQNDQHHPGKNFAALKAARTDGVGYVYFARNWLNTRWRS